MGLEEGAGSLSSTEEVKRLLEKTKTADRLERKNALLSVISYYMTEQGKIELVRLSKEDLHELRMNFIGYCRFLQTHRSQDDETIMTFLYTLHLL